MMRTSFFLFFLLVLYFGSNAQPVIIYGDTRTNHEIHKEIVNAIVKESPAAVFHTGDLVEFGWSKKQWKIFNEITEKMREVAPFYPTTGNHEIKSWLYYRNFKLPNNEKWYSVDIQNVHFVVLNSNSRTKPNSKQCKWLEKDLQSLPEGTKSVVAVFHHPPYCTGFHDEDERHLRESFVPILEKYNVPLIFNGHDHCYERSFVNGAYYIVIGGGGAPLYKQSRQREYSQKFLSDYNYCRLFIMDNIFKVEVLGIDGQLLDSFSVPF